jgi:hypothetical protein
MESSVRWEYPPFAIARGGRAAVQVFDPIFAADLQPVQYAYRRGRSALEAVRLVHKLIHTGHVEIVDADLASYFDLLPHAELLKLVARRVVDGAMLHLKMWLTAPVEETDERGNKHRSTRNRDHATGGTKLNQMMTGWANSFCLGRAYPADAQLSAGEIGVFPPGVGCVNSARPLRCAGCGNGAWSGS